MKKLHTAMAISVTVMLVVLPLAYGQGQPEKVFQGQLTKVDANAKWISVKGTGDTEMMFDYTDATQVIGSEKSVQGLAGKAGTELKVTYRDAAGKHIATRIETIEKR